MEMETFWSTVPDSDTMDFSRVIKEYPEAAAAAADMGCLIPDATFAFSVIPNCGPGGPTSEEDEEAVGDDDSDDCFSDGPSLGGDKALMAYCDEVDELYTWQKDSWVLWNY